MDSPDSAADHEKSLSQSSGSQSDKTAVLYLNTPNNPTGRVMPREWIEALVPCAARKNLWIISDEVYEGYNYQSEHVYTRPLCPEGAFSVYSFSKAYGMIGNRVGYIVSPAELMPSVAKYSTHLYFSVPTASQLSAMKALEVGGPWVRSSAESYYRTGSQAAEILGLPAPQGSTFLFFDVADSLDERGLVKFLLGCVENGIFVAPGPSFGPYNTHVRLCFTAVEPERVINGVRMLQRIREGR